jgi:hypothetical protein
MMFINIDTSIVAARSSPSYAKASEGTLLRAGAAPLRARPAKRVSAKQGGGEGGIRTHGTLARTTVFETVPIDHSGTSPGARL